MWASIIKIKNMEGWDMMNQNHCEFGSHLWSNVNVFSFPGYVFFFGFFLVMQPLLLSLIIVPKIRVVLKNTMGLVCIGGRFRTFLMMS